MEIFIMQSVSVYTQLYYKCVYIKIPHLRTQQTFKTKMLKPIFYGAAELLVINLHNA